MEMRLTDTDVVLLDGETQVNIKIITSFILLVCDDPFEDILYDCVLCY